MPHEKRQPSRFEIVGVALLLVALAALLYRDWVRENATPTVAALPAGVSSSPSDTASRRDAFEAIYRQGVWAKDATGLGTSGSGSTLEATRPYRAFLQSFLRTHAIRSVVDAGCGDWEFSQAINWTGIDYLGLDIVPSVIEANKRRYGKSKVRFAVADIVHDELPPADLLLVKDVLQHLSNEDIARFLAQLPRYRHVLLVNDVLPHSLSAAPADTPTGHYRPIDPTQPPYSLPGTKVLVWRHGGTTKLVVHLQRGSGPVTKGTARPPMQK